jgi:transcription antitermination factor NusG
MVKQRIKISGKERDYVKDIHGTMIFRGDLVRVVKGERSGFIGRVEEIVGNRLLLVSLDGENLIVTSKDIVFFRGTRNGEYKQSILF